MGRRGKTKPYDPVEAARQAAERERYTRNTPSEWGVNEEAVSAQGDIHQEKATRTKVRRLQRFDVFHLLHARGSITEADLGAVRRLQTDLATEYGVDGEGAAIARVDGAKGEKEFRSIDAGNRTREVLMRLDTPHRMTLLALSLPEVVKGERVNWKQVVRDLHGDIDRDAQVRRVKLACGALTAAYQDIDYGQRRAA